MVDKMDFSKLRVQEIHTVLRYKPTSTQWTVKNRRHHIMGIQLSGKALHTFKYGKFVMPENCIYFLNQKDDYKVNVIEQTEAFSIHFTTYEDISTDSFCIPIADSTNLFSAIKKAENAKASNNEFVLFSLFYSICAEFEKIRNKTYFPKDKRIIVAKEYIDIHFLEKGCLDVATEESGVCVRHFRELFRNSYNITPNKYILSKKIEYAKALLSTSSISISEIAALCDFSDMYYFSKVFKQQTGMPPSRWK